MRRTAPLWLLAGLTACADRLEGPVPSATGVDPQLVCNDQLVTTVTLSGDALAPLATGVLGEDPKVVLPSLVLTQTSGIDGAPSAGEVVDLGAVTRWLDDATMQFDVLPENAVPIGVYDLRVQNPDGQAADYATALAVAPPPVLSGMSPQVLCVDEGAVEVVLSGEAFLVVGETLPVVTLGGLDLTPDAAEDCFDLAGPVAGRSCRTLRVTIPQDALAPGVHGAVVTNPATAACATTETVEFEIVPEPVLTDVEPEPNCLEQGDRGFVATGENFLVLADDTPPDVTFGATTVPAETWDGCTALTGPAGGQLCTSLTFTLPMGAEAPAVHMASVQCPAPAACESDTVDVELVPEPTLEIVEADLLCVAQGDNELVLTGTGFVKLADGTLPMVEVGDGFAALADSAEDCAPLEGPNGGESCATLRITLPIDAVAVGIHDVLVTNPYPADCLTPAPVPLEVIAAPVLSEVRPLLTCLEQGDEEIALTGTGFLVLADGTLPQVTVGSVTVAASAASDCAPLLGPSGGELCTGLVATLAQGALPAEVHAVSVTNPAPADCVTEEAHEVEVAEAPVLASIGSALVCGELDETFTLTGDGFLVADGAMPTVRLGDFEAPASGVGGCVDLLGPVTGQRCTELTLDVPKGTLAAGLYDVSVVNPPDADCVTNEAVALEVVGVPTVADLEPGQICDGAGNVQIGIVGAGFLRTGGASPAVSIGGKPFAVEGMTDCAALTGSVSGELCGRVDITIPAGTFTTIGNEPVAVVNPDPAACAIATGTVLEVTPPPDITSSTPAVTCSGSDLTILGTGFGDDSVITVGGKEAVLTSSSATKITAEIPLGLALGTPHGITITNPGECEDALPNAVTLLEPPELTSVKEMLVCGEQLDNVFTFTGKNLLRTSTEKPTITLGAFTGAVDTLTGCTALGGGAQKCTGGTFTVPKGTLDAGVFRVRLKNPKPADCDSIGDVKVEVLGPPSLVELVPPEQCWDLGEFDVVVKGDGFLKVGGKLPTVKIGAESFAAVSASACTSLTGPAGGELCDEVTITVPAATWDAAQTLPVSITNPAPAACASTESVDFDLFDPPTVTAVEPPKVCYGGLTVTVRGTGFRETPAVFFDGKEAKSVTYKSPTELEVVIPDTMPPALYDVKVVNPEGCEDTLPDGLEVVKPPIVFFVDPPNVYNGIPIQGTVYVSGINDGVDDVWMRDASGSDTKLDFKWDVSDPNKVLATIPEGLAEGDYDMFVLDAVGCEVSLESALFVEKDLTLTVSDVDPPFGWTDAHSPVVVSGAGFADVPRLYLSPDVPGPGTTATELRSVVWRDAKTLDAIVSPGLPVDIYDVIVVNPDGAVGLLPGGFEVTALPPPIVDAVAPGTVPASGSQTLTVTGSDFRTPKVVYDCVDPATGASTKHNGVVSGATADTFKVTIPAGTISQGVCTLTVTNGDGTYSTYAAISVTSPAQNLYAWKSATDMTTGRRAPVSVAGRATRTARYLYAIGGDSGAASGALTSIERAPVGVYGGLGAWAALPDPLPAKRTLAGVATIGRFVYLVGGHDGTKSTNAVLRAQVLDPIEAPQITEVDLQYATGAGMLPGTYIYRIAALYPADFLPNPSGESLAGDPFVIRIPDISQKLKIELNWTPDADASGYRIYRSPTPGAGSRAEVKVADIGAVSTWVDDGSATPGSLTPLPAGALGKWATLANLSVPREAACVGVGQDPGTPGAWYVYAGGGRNGTTYHSSIEYLRVDEVDEHDQAVASAWKTSARALSTARAECGGYSVTNALNSAVKLNDTWIYFGGGKTTGGGMSTNVDAGLVTAGGEIGSFTAVTKMKGQSGYGFAAASNFLYAIGGQNGTPGDQGNSSEMCAAAGGGCSGGVPQLRNWNALGVSLTATRYLPASAQESSVIFIVGGQTGAAAASKTVDWTNY